MMLISKQLNNTRKAGANQAPAFLIPKKETEEEAMAVFRVEKTKDYTIMSNHHLKDRRLSL